MAIQDGGVQAVTVGELLSTERFDLRIPHYQRPFSWRPETALRLVDDIREAQSDPVRSGTPYVLGAVILHQNDQSYEVVDGQQRLLTLRMIRCLLNGDVTPEFDPDPDTPVGQVWIALSQRLSVLVARERSALLEYIGSDCQAVLVITDDLDEAFRVFDSQNYRGKPLAPHDLLKAHHLREMRRESQSMKSAVVEAWESVADEDLDRLFSRYLYRIVNWSRSKPAPGFSAADIHAFKGIRIESVESPSARYHAAAQLAIPMLSRWDAQTDPNNHEIGRMRFQLDMPLAAGRPFFDMVSFMLEELKYIIREGFEGDRGQFSIYQLETLGTDKDSNIVEHANRGRYRYVSELYVGALLYFVNRFGTEHLNEARRILFRWAYAIRVRRLRVQYKSMDNWGSDGDSAFAIIRNAESWRALEQLDGLNVEPYRSGHEVGLVELITEKGQR